MSKLLLLLFLNFSLFAQENTVLDEDTLIDESPTFEYVSLADNKVYDVEIIVFAYRNPLPNDKTYKNKAIFDDSQAISLQAKPEEYPEIDYLMFADVKDTSADIDKNTATEKNDSTKYTIPLDDTEDNTQALVWFEHTPEKFTMTPIWDRLVKKANIVPLIHKSWRQPETPFEHPSYVKLNNIKPIEKYNKHTSTETLYEALETTTTSIVENTAVIDAITINTDGNFIANEEEDDGLHENLYADFTLTGMVALSQGRFMHFGHKLNLFRTYHTEDNVIKNMVFSLIERKQLKTDELNYFDSPWLGSIVKITEYTGEQEDENIEEE